MTLHQSLPLLEVRYQPQGLVEGYASVFGGVDSYGDTIVPGAYQKSLAQHRKSGTTPVMLWSHKQESPIGRWITLAEDARGLSVSGQLNMKTTAGQEAYAHLQAGDLNGLSIGFRVAPGGAEYKGGVTYLKEIELLEVSVVAVPADSAARISSVKSGDPKPATLRELEGALERIGFSRREARNIAAKGFGAVSETESSEELIASLKAATQLFKKD